MPLTDPQVLQCGHLFVHDWEQTYISLGYENCVTEEHERTQRKLSPRAKSTECYGAV
jgi:hypothetical protein